MGANSTPEIGSNFMDLKTKADIHLARKLWHFFGVMAILGIYINVTRSQSLQIAAGVTSFALGLDILRQSFPTVNKAVFAVLGRFMRAHERNSWAGTSFLLIGVSFIVYVYSRDVVILSLLFLAVADPFAGYVGVRFGKDKIVGNKSLQGSLAAFAACTVIAAVYFFVQNFMVERILIVSLMAGIIGAVSELIPIGKLDDNLTFPILSSTMLWLLFSLFGGA